MARTNNIQKTLDAFGSIRIPTAKCKQVHKDSDERRLKRSDRKLKYKQRYED